jgi:hypothetical protein
MYMDHVVHLVGFSLDRGAVRSLISGNHPGMRSVDPSRADTLSPGSI